MKLNNIVQSPLAYIIVILSLFIVSIDDFSKISIYLLSLVIFILIYNVYFLLKSKYYLLRAAYTAHDIAGEIYVTEPSNDLSKEFIDSPEQLSPNITSNIGYGIKIEEYNCHFTKPSIILYKKKLAILGFISPLPLNQYFKISYNNIVKVAKFESSLQILFYGKAKKRQYFGYLSTPFSLEIENIFKSHNYNIENQKLTFSLNRNTSQHLQKVDQKKYE